MPQYAIIATHDPSGCPSANKAVREFVKKTFPKIPELARKHNVKVQVNVHLDPSHQSFMLAEAPSAEAVRDLLFESGFIQWNTATIYPVSQIDELVKRVDQFTPIQ